MTEDGGAENALLDRWSRVLKSLVAESGLTVREVERRAGLGRGSLGAALRNQRRLNLEDVKNVLETAGWTEEDLYTRLLDDVARREGDGQPGSTWVNLPRVLRAIRSLAAAPGDSEDDRHRQRRAVETEAL